MIAHSSSGRPTEWNTAADNSVLSEDEVHVWRTTLSWSPARIDDLRQILSPDEREKSERFHFDLDRKRHVVGRGLLRTLLGRHLGMAPDGLRFDYAAYGKPGLAASVVQTTLQFNVSHSGEFILIALALGREVGIDVEQIRTDIEVDEIAARFFSSAERRSLASLAGTPQYEAFFACWTRKEAYIKARGDGLSLPLDQFDVTLLPRQAARLLATRPDPAEAHRWSLHDLDLGQGYKAALAVAGSPCQLKCWHWAEDDRTEERAGNPGVSQGSLSLGA